jgi:hypothetical protein
MPEELIAIVLGGITLITPVIWILTKHQQKMTQLLNGGGGGGPQQSVLPQQAELQRDMVELKQIVNQQTILLDNLARSQAELKAALMARDEIRDRINS